MQETNKYTVFNIREYLNGQNGELGEDELFQILSEFSCEKNKDVERFAKNQSVEFAKKQQSNVIKLNVKMRRKQVEKIKHNEIWVD